MKFGSPLKRAVKGRESLSLLQLEAEGAVEPLQIYTPPRARLPGEDERYIYKFLLDNFAIKLLSIRGRISTDNVTINETESCYNTMKPSYSVDPLSRLPFWSDWGYIHFKENKKRIVISSPSTSLVPTNILKEACKIHSMTSVESPAFSAADWNNSSAGAKK